MMKKSFLLLLLFFGGTSVFAQSISFSKVFSNYPLNPENGWDAIEIQNGYLLISTSRCVGVIPEQVCCSLCQINTDGDIVWFKQYNFYPTRGGSIVSKDHLIYISGSKVGADNQFSLYCLNSMGDILWQKEYGDPAHDEGSPLLTAIDGDNFMLCGSKKRDITGPGDYIQYMVKTDIQGDSVTSFTFGESNAYSISRSLLYTTAHKSVAAYIFCPDTCFWDTTVGIVSFEDNGSQLWNVELPVSENPKSQPSVIQTDSETLAVSWYADTFISFQWDDTPPALYYLNLAGAVKHKVVFNNQTLNEISRITPVGGGLVGCGGIYVDALSIDTFAAWVFRMSADRQLLWSRTFRDTAYGARPYALNHVIPTSDGGYLAFGTIVNNMTGVTESHNWLLKLDSTGCLLPGCGANNIATGAEEPVFLQGAGISVFPNPAASVVHISFPAHVPVDARTRIQMLSSDGRTIGEWPAYEQNTIDVSLWKPGLYYAVVMQGNSVLLSKRVVVGH